MWCCSGSPVPFFAVVAFVACRRRRVIFLRGAVYDGRKGQSFKRPSRSGAHHVVARSKRTQTHRPRRAQLWLRCLGRREAKCRVMWQIPQFMQNPAMKHHLLSTGNKRLAEASHLDPVWGIGLRADDPRADDPRQWRGKKFLGEALSAVREEIRDSETGFANSASAGRFHTPTGNAGIHEISSAPQSCSLTTASACQGLAKVLLRNFRPISRTRRPTKARKFWR